MRRKSARKIPVIISLGSNLGDRRHSLRNALERLRGLVTVVRVSSVYETEPVDSPPESPPYLNAVVLGLWQRSPRELLEGLLAIESDLGRRRTGARNEPRVIDLDLILFGPHRMRTPELTLPHPRYRTRNFVLEPIRELRISWIDPVTGKPVTSFRGKGGVRRVGPLY